MFLFFLFFFFQAEDGIRDKLVTGVQTCALPISTAETPGARSVAAATPQPPGGRSRPGSRAVLAGHNRGRHGVGWGVRDAGHRALQRRRGDPAPLPAGYHARRVAQPSVGRAGLELRAEDAGGPLLPQPAGPSARGGGLDPVRRGERRPGGPADRLLVAAGAGGREPPREVPAALPAAVARAAGSRGRRVRPLGAPRGHSGGCTMILPPALRQVSRLRPAARSRSGTRWARRAAITSAAVWCATTSCVINSAPSEACPEPTWNV